MVPMHIDALRGRTLTIVGESRKLTPVKKVYLRDSFAPTRCTSTRRASRAARAPRRRSSSRRRRARGPCRRRCAVWLCCVAPVIAAHARPFALQRSQRYVKMATPADQAPLSTVSFVPAVVIFGCAVDTSAVAFAATGADGGDEGRDARRAVRRLHRHGQRLADVLRTGRVPGAGGAMDQTACATFASAAVPLLGERDRAVPAHVPGASVSFFPCCGVPVSDGATLATGPLGAAIGPLVSESADCSYRPRGGGDAGRRVDDRRRRLSAHRSPGSRHRSRRRCGRSRCSAASVVRVAARRSAPRAVVDGERRSAVGVPVTCWLRLRDSVAAFDATGPTAGRYDDASAAFVVTAIVFPTSFAPSA